MPRGPPSQELRRGLGSLVRRSFSVGGTRGGQATLLRSFDPTSWIAALAKWLARNDGFYDGFCCGDGQFDVHVLGGLHDCVGRFSEGLFADIFTSISRQGGLAEALGNLPLWSLKPAMELSHKIYYVKSHGREWAAKEASGGLFFDDV